MFFDIIMVVLIPIVMLGGTFILAGGDLIRLFNGGNVLGRLFSDLIHVLLFWVICIAAWFWVLWMLLAHFL